MLFIYFFLRNIVYKWLFLPENSILFLHLEKNSKTLSTMPKNKGKGGKNRRRGKNENEQNKRELELKEEGQECSRFRKKCQKLHRKNIHF